MLEAARIDGASWWQTTWRVKLPMVMHVIAITLLMRLIDAFRVLEVIYILTFGGPGDSTEILSLHIYKTAFVGQRLGSAAAISVLLLVVVAGLSWAALRLSNPLKDERAMKRRQPALVATHYAALILLAIVCVTPIVVMFATSLKFQTQIFNAGIEFIFIAHAGELPRSAGRGQLRALPVNSLVVGIVSTASRWCWAAWRLWTGALSLPRPHRPSPMRRCCCAPCRWRCSPSRCSCCGAGPG